MVMYMTSFIRFSLSYYILHQYRISCGTELANEIDSNLFYHYYKHNNYKYLLIYMNQYVGSYIVIHWLQQLYQFINMLYLS